MSKDQLYLAGERSTGLDVRTQNVTAALSVANVVKSSLGPVGLDKMLVDDVGEVTITNDGATILSQLEVEHPAARVLVQLSEMQDKEVGDGTTSVVILASELLKRAHELVKNGIHPTSVMAGYRMAMKESIRFIKSELAVKTDKLGREVAFNVARTTLSSKIFGRESDFFANMAVDAMAMVKDVDPESGKARYPVKSVGIIKQHGGSAKDSSLIHGFVLGPGMGRAAQGMPRTVTGAKIALLDIDLRKTKMAMGVQVVVTDVSKLEDIRKREADITKERIDLILGTGANVILTTKGIDDMALKYFVEAGAIAVRRCKKEDLRRIAKLTGGTLMITLADMEGNETYDASMLGQADEVIEERICDDDHLVIKGGKTQRSCCCLLRGANMHMLDEVERSLHDALCAVKRTMESASVVPGGGSVEAALSIYLENFATTIGSREQLAIAEFAEAMLVIPKQLAVNAAQDATDIVAKLRSNHNAAQSAGNTDPDLKRSGLDCISGKIQNNLAAGIIEPALSKVKMIQFATEAAITVLRIDDMIKLAPEEQQQQ
uniref:T-complex protein 1 subunit alpha n=1 Tax=Phaeocystis antarctica TaxID=33657 RepID=A0A7S0EXG9_9EUKA